MGNSNVVIVNFSLLYELLLIFNFTIMPTIICSPYLLQSGIILDTIMQDISITNRYLKLSVPSTKSTDLTKWTTKFF